MPTSGAIGFQIKRTRHIQSSAEVMGADVNALFQAARTDIIHSASVCLSVTQLPRAV